MDNLIELISEDGHTFLAYLAQPKEKPKAGIVILQENVTKYPIVL